jgi:flagellar motor switch protein FliM
VLDLQVGDVVRLSSAADDVVTLSIDGKERFKGKIGLRRFRKSIQIIEIIDTEKDAVKRALENFENLRHEKISGVKEIVDNNVEEEE